MKMIKNVFASAALSAALIVPSANASTALVIGAGSSAMWQAAAVGGYNDLAHPTGSGAGHYTVKGSCTAGSNHGQGNCAQIFDQRTSGTTSIAVQPGNLWVVWDNTHTNVWAYISVDSTVGDRSFFAAPRAQLQLSTDLKTKAGQNLITNLIFEGQASDSTTGIPADVFAALDGKSITTAFTDIRPEDAKAATTRTDDVLGAATGGVLPGLGLGYGTGPNTLVGTNINSTYSSAFAQPVNFNLSGSDPFNSNNKVPAYVTVPVGAAPIVFVMNRTNASGLGLPTTPTNLTHAQLQSMFSGCPVMPTTNVPVTVIQREPLSGTMNTTEYTAFEAFGAGANGSQEKGINPAAPNSNPLNLAGTCGKGKRTRGIGTGDLVNNGVVLTPDSIGYAFFSFGNVSKLAVGAGGAMYRYETIDGVDPIHATYTNGQLPTCTAPCPAAAGSTYTNVRNGTYKQWSLLRAVTDASGVNLSNTKALVTALQNNVNKTVPDLVPFTTTNGSDPGLKKYRSHFTQAGIAGNNGLSGQVERGGDVGGCIETTGPAPGILNCHQ